MENKTKKTTVFRYLYIGLTILIIVLIGALDPNFEGMWKALEALDVLWLFLCFLAVFLYWFTDAFLIKHISSYMYGKYSIWSSFKVGLVGLYYGALTPSSTGGQPMQVIYMRRDGISTGIGTGIVGVKFVVYQLSLCTIYIIAMILDGANFYFESNQIFWLTTFGFLVNLVLVGFIGMTMFNRTFVDKCGFGIIRLLSKMRILKTAEKVDATNASFIKTMDEFHQAMSYILQHKFKVLVSYLISALNLIFLFSISFCVYRAMGFNEKTFFELLSLQAFLYLAVSFIPTPGSAGASEGGFYLFFGKIFPGEHLFVGMLLWRFLTYYAILFAGSIVVLFAELKQTKKIKTLSSSMEISSDTDKPTEQDQD